MQTKRAMGLAVAALVMALACPLFAQEEAGVHFTGNIGGGFSNPLYTAGKHLDTGWTVNGGAGASFGEHFGLLGEFMFNSFGINNATLQRLNFPGGDMHLWSITAEPMLRLNRSGRFDAYVIGGGGLYHRLIEFTAPSVSTFTAFDPFFGVVYPVAVPTNQVLRSQSVNKGGLNIGGGLMFGLSGRTKLYVDVRYHHMYTRPNATTILPVTFGLRW